MIHEAQNKPPSPCTAQPANNSVSAILSNTVEKMVKNCKHNYSLQLQPISFICISGNRQKCIFTVNDRMICQIFHSKSNSQFLPYHIDSFLGCNIHHNRLTPLPVCLARKFIRRIQSHLAAQSRDRTGKI